MINILASLASPSITLLGRPKPLLSRTFPNLALLMSSSSTPLPSKSPAKPWECGRCTFLNPATQKSSCEQCFEPPQWSCGACTFLNPASSAACRMCGTKAPSPGGGGSGRYEVVEIDADDVRDAAVGSVFLPLRRCAGKRTRAASLDVDEVCDGGGSGSSKEPGKCAKKGNSKPSINKRTFKIMTYNVWFREDLELYRRMEALGNLIKQHDPELICFQEVTPNIYALFRGFDWWSEYKCSLSDEMAVERPYYCMQMSKLPVKSFSHEPFANSMMGRELCLADINIGRGLDVVLATTHLESPCPAPPRWDQMYSKERVAQANESLNSLGRSKNVIFCGDMNWDDKKDGAFPLPNGWIDAWTELKPGENGWTYDTKANMMLSGNRALQKRLDRFVCKLPDFKIESIEMIGMQPIPGISYHKDKKVRNETRKLELPILPSDHFGLVLTITRTE